MQSVQYLITILFNLYLMVVLLRFWLQLAKADFYNPLSQFVVKATNPLVLPLRRVIPSLGMVDSATLLLAYLVATMKFVLLQLLLMGSVAIPSTLIIGLLSLIKEAGFLIFWVVILRALLSWFSQGRNPIEQVMHQLTEPLLRPIRRILPPLGGLDLSVLVLIIALQFLYHLFGDLFRGI
jgi:YggT family protein